MAWRSLGCGCSRELRGRLRWTILKRGTRVLSTLLYKQIFGGRTRDLTVADPRLVLRILSLGLDVGRGNILELRVPWVQEVQEVREVLAQYKGEPKVLIRTHKTTNRNFRQQSSKYMPSLSCYIAWH